MKTGFLIALYALGVYFLFSLSCMMVSLSNGNQWWIAKKIRLGALLLSLSPTLMLGCPPPPTAESQSFSDDLEENDISVSPAKTSGSRTSLEVNAEKPDSLIQITEPSLMDSVIMLDLFAGDSLMIKGRAMLDSLDRPAFRLLGAGDSVVQQADLEMDELGSFRISLDQQLPPGDYQLVFSDSSAAGARRIVCSYRVRIYFTGCYTGVTSVAS